MRICLAARRQMLTGLQNLCTSGGPRFERLPYSQNLHNRLVCEQLPRGKTHPACALLQLLHKTKEFAYRSIFLSAGCTSARFLRSRSRPEQGFAAAAVRGAAQDAILPAHLQQNTQRGPVSTPEAPARQDSPSDSFPPRRPRRGGSLNSRPPEESRPGPAPEQQHRPALAPEQQQHSPAEHADQRRSTAAQASTSGRAAPGEEPASSSGAPIRDLLASHGILLRRYSPGQQNSLICPRCKGGGSSEASFSVNILGGSREAVWHCHRGTCGWEGGCSIDSQQPATSGKRSIRLHLTLLANLGRSSGSASH
jgi:hypothetical protein